MSTNLSTESHQLRENCNEEYVVLDVLASGLLVQVGPRTIDWASGVRELFNQARKIVRAGADPTGLPDEPPGIASGHEASRLVDGIAKWATALSKPQPPPQPTEPATTGPAARPLNKIAAALALLIEYPDWTNKAIAEAVGCSPPYLSQNSQFLAARKAIKGIGQESRQRSHKHRGSDMDEYADD
jgi:hypothetical protein